MLSDWQCGAMPCWPKLAIGYGKPNVWREETFYQLYPGTGKIQRDSADHSRTKDEASDLLTDFLNIVDSTRVDIFVAGAKQRIGAPVAIRICKGEHVSRRGA